MSASVYPINKGINNPVQFKGLKAQYIWYLGGGLIALLVVFAVMYITGINTFICLGLIVLMGAVLFTQIYKLSNRYGQYGMMKLLAKKNIPAVVRSASRKFFIHLLKTN